MVTTENTATDNQIIKFSQDELIEIRAELIAANLDTPKSVFNYFIVKIIVERLCKLSIVKNSVEWIDELNRVGSITGTNTSLFTSNFVVMQDLWDAETEHQEEIINVIKDKFIKTLEDFSFTKIFVDELHEHCLTLNAKNTMN